MWRAESKSCGTDLCQYAPGGASGSEAAADLRQAAASDRDLRYGLCGFDQRRKVAWVGGDDDGIAIERTADNMSVDYIAAFAGAEPNSYLFRPGLLEHVDFGSCDQARQSGGPRPATPYLAQYARGDHRVPAQLVHLLNQRDRQLAAPLEADQRSRVEDEISPHARCSSLRAHSLASSLIGP